MKIRITSLLVITVLAIIGCAKQKVPAPKVDLHSAVVTDNFEVIKQHIKAGTDLNVLEASHASTPLITAAALGKTDAARLLIDAGADLNTQNADGASALHIAAGFDKPEIVKLLIDAPGIDLDRQNNEGATPLHTAAFLGRVEIVKALLAKGADKTIKNKSGQTAYETVVIPFEDVKIIYDAIGAGLRPLGVILDYDQIQAARPQIAEMLRED